MTRYFVRREECWGGTYVYAPWDSDGHKKAGPFSNDERTAQRRVDRLNEDWDKYQARRFSEYATPPRPRGSHGQPAPEDLGLSRPDAG